MQSHEIVAKEDVSYGNKLLDHQMTYTLSSSYAVFKSWLVDN